MKLTELSLPAAAAALSARELSSSELTEAYLAEITARDGALGAYLTLTADAARAAAARADKARAAGEATSPLAGIPAALKDNLCTKGVRTTCASKMLEAFVPPYDATVIERLNAAGMVPLGKVNMDEFAMGSSTENSALRLTRNPCGPDRVPGGSSGGSAAAVAAGLCAYALGSDTGGSIRQPAAFCGVVGLKPTYGRVSRYGLVAFASSLDQIGPLARDVASCALVYDAIAGHDPRDATSSARPHTPTADRLGGGVAGLRIALPREFFGRGLSPAVKTAVLAAADRYAAAGAELVDLSLPSLSSALPAYYVISSAEASSNLARFDGVRYGRRSAEAETLDQLYQNSRDEGFGPEVKRRILLGTFALSSGYYDAYYKKALQMRTRIKQDFDEIFSRCDLLLSPVAPTTAYRIGEHRTDPTEMYLGDIYTVPVNIAGLPALSLPCGRDADGLPVGLQLIGRAWDEETLLRAAYTYESESEAKQ